MKNTLIAAILLGSAGFFPAGGVAAPERTAAGHSVISRRDPGVEITLPRSARYVGTDRFLLSKPTLGHTETCELYAFVEADKGRRVSKFWWVQFEGYLPSHPDLHMTYDSPRRVTIGGLDFYVDAGVSHAKPMEPGSDGAHFYSLLASHGYRRDDVMWVRLVHLTDATKRKELMIIYAESLKPTGFSAAQLGEGGTEHARWAAIEDRLVRRAEQSVEIKASA